MTRPLTPTLDAVIAELMAWLHWQVDGHWWVGPLILFGVCMLWIAFIGGVWSTFSSEKKDAA